MRVRRAQDSGMQRSPGHWHIVAKTRAPLQKGDILNPVEGSPNLLARMSRHRQPPSAIKA